MKAREALIAWTPASWQGWPTAGMVKVGPLISGKDAADWSDPYGMTGGAAYVAVRKMEGYQSKAKLFIDFHTVVVRDGVDAQEAHKAFLVVDEYRSAISPDIDGADPE